VELEVWEDMLKFLIAVSALFLVVLIKFVDFYIPGYTQKIPENKQAVEIKNDVQETTDNRNDFSRNITENPESVSWNSADLFLKVIKLLEDPTVDMGALFDHTLHQFDSDEYYAGAYLLKDHVKCNLLWISPNNQFSLGVEFEGSSQDINGLERKIEDILGQASSSERESDMVRRYWLNKKYRNMNYYIETAYAESTEKKILRIMIHPQIYH